MFDRSPSMFESLAVLFSLWLVSLAFIVGLIVAVAFIVKAIVS